MATIDIATRQIHCRIVYYGIGFCGKTTNLQYIHSQVGVHGKSDLLSIATETERTLFFDFLPLDLGTVHGFRVRFHLYTVPGQVLYERTRATVLKGADGVIFVADSQREKLVENRQSLIELARNLQRLEKKITEFPLIMQYNKRDMPNAMPMAQLEAQLNVLKVPSFEAIAPTGAGVMETLRAASRAVVSHL